MNTRSTALTQAWKEREDYTHGLAGTKFHNCWRSRVFTIKGKAAGFDPRWSLFKNFAEDMYPTYEEGKKLYRKDHAKPFSKDNCSWVFPGDLASHKLLKIEYNGEIKTLKEWCLLYSISYTGARQRYHKGKNYTVDEVLFGRKKKAKRSLVNVHELNHADARIKASKMISAYKCKDKKKSLLPECDLTIEWFIDNILKRSCSYCGTNKHVGADRLNNKISHIISNIIPCCFRCNAVRNTHFTHEQMLKIGKFLKENIDASQE